MAAADLYPRITNSLLFFRHLMIYDVNGSRGLFATPRHVGLVSSHDRVRLAAEPVGLAPNWSGLAICLWKTALSDSEKLLLHAQFEAWRDAQVA
jgi:hypothetical protein